MNMLSWKEKLCLTLVSTSIKHLVRGILYMTCADLSSNLLIVSVHHSFQWFKAVAGGILFWHQQCATGAGESVISCSTAYISHCIRCFFYGSESPLWTYPYTLKIWSEVNLGIFWVPFVWVLTISTADWNPFETKWYLWDLGLSPSILGIVLTISTNGSGNCRNGSAYAKE